MTVESEADVRLRERRSLQEILRSGDLPTPDRTVRLVCAAAHALDALHARQVVHGAISPAAFQIDADDQVTLLPPGCAGSAGTDLSRLYWSPQRRAGEPPRPADDLYALGLLAYQLVAGRAPDPAWLAGPRVDAEAGLAPGNAAAATSGPPLHGEIEAVLRAQLAWAPATRPASGAELARELERAAGTPAAEEYASSAGGQPAVEPAWAAARRVAQARDARRLAQAAASDAAQREMIRRRQETERRLRETERLMPPASRVLLRGVTRSSHPELPLPGGWVALIAIVLCSVYLLPVFFMLFPHG